MPALRPLDGPNLRFTRFVSSGALPQDLTLENLYRGSYTTLHPFGSSALPSPITTRLETSFSVALTQVVTRPSCRALFSALDADGLAALATSAYLPTSPDQKRDVCDRGAMAFTQIGTSTTWLCPSFARLPQRVAAIALIHEALHYAGLPEHPVVRLAPTARQINSIVATNCGL